MKVLFQSYNTCCQNVSGGVNVRLHKIAQLLSERGLEVNLFDAFTSKVLDCDILHIFGIDLENWSLVNYAKQNNKKVVISSILPLQDRAKLSLYEWLSHTPLMTTHKVLKRTLSMADSVIAESVQEKVFLGKYFGVDLKKIHVIPNGMDTNEYKGKDIFEELGFEGLYVLQVGRFDNNKNQLNVIKALKESDIQMVFVGGASGMDKSYYEKCRHEAKGHNNIHFLGWLGRDSNLLKSAYSNAALVIIPSYQETFGLVILEAVASRTKVAMSRTLPIRDYDEIRMLPCFNPSSPISIRKCIISSLSSVYDNANYENIIKRFSWDSVISDHIDLYSRLCDCDVR